MLVPSLGSRSIGAAGWQVIKLLLGGWNGDVFGGVALEGSISGAIVSDIGLGGQGPFGASFNGLQWLRVISTRQ